MRPITPPKNDPREKRTEMHNLCWIIIAIVAVLIVGHVRRYSTPCEDVQILQVPLASLTPALLAERRPIVVQERMVDPKDLLDTVFKWRYLFVVQGKKGQGGRQLRNTWARFTLIYGLGEEEEEHVVELTHPSFPAEPVEIVLRRGRTLILPPWWTYTVLRREEVEVLGLV